MLLFYNQLLIEYKSIANKSTYLYRYIGWRHSVTNESRLFKKAQQSMTMRDNEINNANRLTSSQWENKCWACVKICKVWQNGIPISGHKNTIK